MTRLRTSAIILISLFAVLILAGIVADRLGASAQATATLMLFLALLSLVATALLASAMRGSVFQVAAETGAPIIILALAGVGVGLALLPGRGSAGLDSAVVLCMAAAFLTHGLLVPVDVTDLPDQSLGDALFRRFQSRLVAVLAAICGLGLMLALAATLGQRAVDILTRVADVSPAGARGIVVLVTLLIILPGGARSIVAASAVAIAIGVVGWVAPVAAGAVRQGALSFDGFMGVLDGYFGDARFDDTSLGWLLAALGLTAVLHLPVSSRNAGVNRHGYALASLGLVAASGLAALAARFLTGLDGVSPVVLSVHRTIPVLFLLTSFALVVHGLARTLVRDILYRLRRHSGTASGRLALQRLVALVLVPVTTLGLLPPLALSDPLARALLLLGAAVPWPLLLLSRWRRVDWRAAACGIASALLAALGVAAGIVPSGPGFAAAGLSCLVAGALAAMVFRPRESSPSPASAAPADVAP
ncbi:MAG: hypothetical protein LCH61_03850 [Proteobacteria bacterium]|nr:hypothetical protein [Pseudomonadota bacterium]